MIGALLCLAFVFMICRHVGRFAEFDRDIAAKEAAREQRGTAS